MGVFFSYILLGLSLAAPIGPINAAQIDQGIKNGFLHSWAIGLGSIVADLFFILCVFFGVVHFLEIPFMKSFLWLFGAFVLFYTAFESFKGTKEIGIRELRSRESLKKTFTNGFLLAITNPLSILFWLGIYGSILADTIHRYNMAQVLLYGGAVLLGLMIWDVFMASVSSGFRKVLTPSLLRVISTLSGLSLLGFAVYFGFQAFQLLFGF
ncbi:Threonine/homoserine/homoserine lactone efflux protein [Halobacillus alkaliphilus]|uniref:Threonine/homoserine/homoserine lactone efflux protein n=1 Tax=Halobacillus alkaliphilus TaxID=396056 RepID=A0A1I2JLA4_9BACI|nr:LysE family transporter [Halobacillus alkaliphilus]SFF54898.1 Threonine/homoserine/homoserine lactone efflux protein [Halobacillus alkaliphilus]